MSKKLERVRARTLSSLKVTKLSAQLQNSITRLAVISDNDVDPETVPENNHKDWRQMRDGALQTKTFGDVMDGWIRIELRYRCNSDRDDLGDSTLNPAYQVERWMLSVLLKSKITYLDWRHMPISTVAPEKLGTNFWRRREATELPTLTNIAAVKVADAMRWSRESPSIGVGEKVLVSHLLQLDPTQAHGHLKNSWTAITNTRELLYKIGFRYEDGPFMQAGTERKYREEIMRRLGCSERRAAILLRDWHKLGWISWCWKK